MLKKIFNHKWKIAIILLIGIGIYFYFSSTQNAEKKIESTKVKKGNIQETLTLSGEIDADEHAVLRFASSGRLTWVGVKEGQYVKKFQTIANIDSRDTKKTLEKYLNTFASDRLDFDQEKNDNTNLTHNLNRDIKEKAERALSKSQYDLNNSILNVELQNIALEYSNLWTPIEGIVVKVDAPNPGVNITPTTAEFEIINPKTIYFSATVEQNDVIKIKEKMPGKLTLDPYPDDEIKANIKTIAFVPKTGETSTVYQVKIEFTPDAKHNLRFGMTGDAVFATREKNNVLYLPTKFVKSEGDKKFVNILKNNNKQKKYIKVGMESDNEIEITSGLNEMETVYYE